MSLFLDEMVRWNAEEEALKRSNRVSIRKWYTGDQQWEEFIQIQLYLYTNLPNELIGMIQCFVLIRKQKFELKTFFIKPFDFEKYGMLLQPFIVLIGKRRYIGRSNFFHDLYRRRRKKNSKLTSLSLQVLERRTMDISPHVVERRTRDNFFTQEHFRIISSCHAKEAQGHLLRSWITKHKELCQYIWWVNYYFPKTSFFME